MNTGWGHEYWMGTEGFFDWGGEMWLGEVVLLRIRGSRKASKYSSAGRIENANWMLDSALTRCAASPKAHRVRIDNVCATCALLCRLYPAVYVHLALKAYSWAGQMPARWMG
jgi:hypothetical protein